MLLLLLEMAEYSLFNKVLIICCVKSFNQETMVLF